MAIDLAAVYQAYADNADYRYPASVAKAKLFINACEGILGLTPEESAHGSERVRYGLTLKQVQTALTRAQAWLNTQTAGGRVSYVDLSYGRGG